MNCDICGRAMKKLPPPFFNSKDSEWWGCGCGETIERIRGNPNVIKRLGIDTWNWPKPLAKKGWMERKKSSPQRRQVA